MLLRESRSLGKQHFLNKETALNRASLTRLNVERLKATLSYFSHLNATGEISDNSYQALVRYACEIFLETEIEKMIQDTLEQKLEQFLVTRILGMEDLLSKQEESSLNLDMSRLLNSK